MRFAVFADDVTVDESRAFCPGASPPDNSCSPANKGTGAPRPPKTPKPDGKGTDKRGQETGHSREQRSEYVAQVREWLQLHHGVELTGHFDLYGPPTMNSIRQVADGIARLDELGITKPSRIEFQDLPGNAPAGYDYISGMVLVDPDGTKDDIQKSIEKGWLSGTLSSEDWGIMVHEMTHHDHRQEIRRRVAPDEQGGQGAAVAKARTIEKVKDLMGRPTRSGPTIDPWDPSLRFGTTARDNGGKPVDSALAMVAAMGVSGYAGTNPLEFVAEVRTGVASGITYPDRVMELYEDYGGPPLPRRRRDL